MRDPARVDRMIELLRQAWHLRPDQRLGQLLDSLLADYEALFYVEDDVTERKLTVLLNEGFEKAWETK